MSRIHALRKQNLRVVAGGGGVELGQRWGEQGQARGSELSEHCGVCM